MSSLAIVLVSIAGFILLMAFAGFIAYNKFAVPAFKPLSEEQQAACAKVVKAGEGFPWVCAHAVKTGKCPCMPCTKQQDAMKG